MIRTGEKAKMRSLAVGKIGVGRWWSSRLLRTAVCVVPLALAVSGCSTMNPGHWFDWARGGSSVDDDPDLDQPVVVRGGKPAAGLVGDSSYGKEYAAPVQRDVAETKPLVKRSPVEAPVQAAAVAAPVAATPVVTAAAAPSGPPAYMPSGEVPAKPDIPDVVPVAAKSQGTLLDHYHQRLRESAVASVPPELAAKPVLGQDTASKDVHLNAPKEPARLVSADGVPESSFLVASLAFGPGSNQLAPSDVEALREVSRLYKKTGGYVRVLGLSVGGNGSPVMVLYSAVKGGAVSAQARAEAAAKELVRLGVPGSRIMVGAVAPSAPPPADNAAARIYLDM